MTKTGDAGAPIAQALSRRKFLSLSGLAVLGLSACGDQSGERQFAGDPRTVESQPDQGTEPSESVIGGSPTAVATAMPVSALLAPRGEQRIAFVAGSHEVTAIDVAGSDGRIVWTNPGRSVWDAAIDSTSSRIALLTSEASGADDWAIEFVDVNDQQSHSVAVNSQGSESGYRPDAVAGGRGGIDWLPDASSVAVSMPTGGLLQVFPDGSQIRLAKASAAKRPAAVAITADGKTIAFVEQPTGSDGSGVYAGSMKAKPIDPIVILSPDRSGNRYAREVGWIGSTARVATIIEREELGNPQGDLFFLDTHGKTPRLAWTSPAGRETASVQSFAISSDALVTAFVTNPSRADRKKPSSVWVMQTDGPSIERFDLPIEIDESRVFFSPEGLVVAGRTGESPGLAASFLLAPNGEVKSIYQQQPLATPEASPAGSPMGSPVASPVGNPSPDAVTGAD